MSEEDIVKLKNEYKKYSERFMSLTDNELIEMKEVARKIGEYYRGK